MTLAKGRNGFREKPPATTDQRIAALVATIERTPRRQKRLLAEYRDGLHQLMRLRYAVVRRRWEGRR